MLREIRIENLGVIDDAVLELSAGLNVVTGETGAGKTMVVSGLGLLLGARADAGLVRTGASKAVVEGVVQVGPEHPATLRALEAGGDAEDVLILARTVSAEGRSKAHVGGRTVPVSVLGELGELLVAVHGQSDQWRLRQPEQHRVVLDRFAGGSVSEPLGRYGALYDDFHQVGAELGHLRGLARDRAREVDVLRTGLEEIEAVDPLPGEDLELRAEDARLAHSDGLRASAGQAHALLTGDSDSLYSGADDPADGLQVRLDALREELTSCAGELSAARKLAATDFGARVTTELSYLAMGKAVVQVDLGRRPDPEGLSLGEGIEPVRFSRHGVDDVEILLAANPGAPARSVAKAASGGELSRVMLALEVVTGSGDVPTFVFDEVDAGVGGRAALDVGARLAALATSAQVIVVTHLAQVAAYADRHLVVRKTDDGHITASGVVAVTGEE